VRVGRARRYAKLMDRMGHSSTQAALIYQHSSAERDRLIADAISQLAGTERRRFTNASGTRAPASFMTLTAQICDHAQDLGFHSGAGDQNRTRTISLGSTAVTAARGADQASLAGPGDPG